MGISISQISEKRDAQLLELLLRHTYSGRKFGKYPYNTRPMESTPLLQPKSGI